MKHIAKVSLIRDGVFEAARTLPDTADAKGNFMNAIWRAWSDYLYEKKNEVAL